MRTTPATILVSCVALGMVGVWCSSRRASNHEEHELERVADSALADAQANPLTRIQKESIRDYVGVFTTEFEVSSFTPCGTADTWWVGATTHSRLAERVKAIVGPKAFSLEAGKHRFFVHWRGALSEKGHYGHLGQYPRELLVTEVTDVRVARSEDCKP